MSHSDLNDQPFDKDPINKETVIDWYLEKLQSGDRSPVPHAMADYIAQHPEVAAEVETLKQFWQPQGTLPEPSTKLRTSFYKSLAEIEQQENSATPVIQTSKTVANDPYYKAAWFQAAAVVLVFVLGLFTGRESFGPTTANDSQQAIAALQEEVSSLSAVMAISMLQKDSASERLAAVSYTRRANMTDPVLLKSLIRSFEQEKSTAVKLAIIDAFKSANFSSAEGGMANGELAQVEQSLFALAVNEPQPMVQMALTQMLLEQASRATKRQLIQQLQASPLNQDVSDFLQLIDAQNRI